VRKKKISPILIVATSIDVDDNKDGFESSKKKTITIIYAIKTSKNFKREFQKR